MKVRSNKGFVRFVLHFTGILCCVIPPIACTLSYFPLWREAGGEHLIAGGTALLLILALIPFYKHIRKVLETCASYVMWLIIFLFSLLMSKVIGEVTVIAFSGFVSNLVGALLMRIGERIKED